MWPDFLAASDEFGTGRGLGARAVGADLIVMPLNRRRPVSGAGVARRVLEAVVGGVDLILPSFATDQVRPTETRRRVDGSSSSLIMT